MMPYPGARCARFHHLGSAQNAAEQYVRQVILRIVPPVAESYVLRASYLKGSYRKSTIAKNTHQSRQPRARSTAYANMPTRNSHSNCTSRLQRNYNLQGASIVGCLTFIDGPLVVDSSLSVDVVTSRLCADPKHCKRVDPYQELPARSTQARSKASSP